jgi:acylphosphatase
MPAREGADAKIARRLSISGRVQGVGYRYAMVEAARALGVGGWVRNRRDGTVEAHVQGNADAVLRLLLWCRCGPPSARVADVATEVVVPDPALGAFAHRPTE